MQYIYLFGAVAPKTGQPFSISQSLIWVGLFFVALIITVIILIKWRENTKVASAVKGSKHEAHTEKAKSDIIIAAIEDGVVLVGADRLIQVFNRGASAISGWPSTEAEGLEYRSVLKLMNGKGTTYTREQDPFEKVLKSKSGTRDNKAVLQTRSDRQIPIHISVSPLLDTEGNITAVVGVFRDVTQERAEELQRAEFISTASHEMRTPVAAIEGYLALALNEHVSGIDAKARGFLEKAHSSTQHLGKLFQDLLTSAKAEDGRLVNHPQVVEIGSFLEQITESLRFAAQKKNLVVDFLIGTQTGEVGKTAIKTRVIRPLYYVYTDGDRLREVVTNIFDNAVKYTDTGKITIGLTGDENVVQFYINDTGSGIPPEDVPHLFQKFYRVDSSATRSIGGTGLGLFISRKIIEISKGRIWVESELDKGSTFYINLPRLSSQKAAELQTTEAQITSQLGN